MLELQNVESGYDETRVLHGVDLAVKESRIHALLGRNGVGKSTTLKTVIGQLPLIKGSMTFDGADISDATPYENARRRLAFVPETRDVFGALTVRENLELAGRLAGPDPAWTIDRVVAFFPNLKERLTHGGHDLSGGEQQMLAIARALMMNPRILILDEPTEGLAPIIIQQIFSQLLELKANGLTVLLVEQNLNFALGLADEVSLMSRGEIVWRGDARALEQDETVQARYLGV